METKTRKIKTAKTSVVLACLLSAFGLATASGQAQDANCKQIQGRGMTMGVTANCTSPIGFCATGVVDGNDAIKGTTFATVLALTPSAGLPGVEPSTVSLFGKRTITTSKGTLSLQFVTLFDTARGEFAEIDTVTGGSDRFEGASGTLWFVGTGTGPFEFAITGRICTARP